MADPKIIDCSKNFENFGLDDRLLRAVAKLGLSKPTLIQSSTIPLALEGKDILARARTGSGKTLAYLLPILQACLSGSESASQSCISGLILVPTRELAEQVVHQIQEMLVYCSEIKTLNIASGVPDKLLRSQLKEMPNVIVGTPSKVLSFLQNKAMVLKSSLKQLVIDEADLVLSFGYEQDVKDILEFLPKICQSFLMSATINQEVTSLKQLVLRNPAILKLEEDKSSDGQLIEYCVRCTSDDKYLLLYVILKLQLIKGRCLIFVNDIDKCYKVRLFLEQFGIRSCVLNSELPLNSRYHIIQEFNKGVYDYIIASDEFKLKGEKDSDDEQEYQEVSGDEGKDEQQVVKKRKTRSNGDKEYGVSRGVDFKSVAAVINFDFPISVKSYTHRIGRTARGGKKGMGLSLVATDSNDEEAKYELVEQKRLARGHPIQPYNFDMKQVNGFRYRAEDSLRVVTKQRVKEARIKELKVEILNSEKLKAHFEDRPKDLDFLKHDTPLVGSGGKDYLKNVPSYLVPNLATVSKEGKVMELPKDFKSHSGPKISFGNKHRDSRRNAKKRHDPLKTFTTKPGGGKRSR